MKRLSYILLAILLIQTVIPSQVYLRSKLTSCFNKAPLPIKPIQQSSNLRLLGPNNETQPVVNEGNSIKLKLTDANGKDITDPSITFTSDSPDVATVDNQGNVQAKPLGFGFATVTAKRVSDSTQIFVVVARVQQAVGMMLTGQMEKDSGGGLYLSDPTKNIVIKKDTAFAAPAPFAGNGMAGSAGDEGEPTSAQLNGPVGVAVDNGAFGGVYIADSLNHKIRKIEGKKIRTVLGTGGIGIKSELINSDEVSFTRAEDIPLNFPQGVAVDVGGQVFVADSDNAAIYQVDFGRKRVKLFAGQPGRKGSIDGKGRQAMFSRPIALNLNGSTRVLNVLDQDSSNKMTVVRQIAPDGTVKTIKKKRATFADEIETLAPDDIIFNNGRAISSDGTGNVYVVDDTGANLITFPVNQDPQLVSLAQPGQGVTFNQATSITVQGTQSFVVDARAISTDQAVKVISVGAPKIDSLSKDTSKLEGGGEVLIIGKNFSQETQLVLGDSLVSNFIVESATKIRFQIPKQLTAGARTLTVSTRGGVDQKQFNIIPKPLSEFQNGIITTFVGGVPYLGDGSLATSQTVGFGPADVAVDGVGNVFIADANLRIRRVDAATRIITTIAGNGTRGFSGDGGPAISAGLSTFSSIAVDGVGNVFIADFNTNRIRKVDIATGIISTVIGNGKKGFSGDKGPAISASLDNPTSISIDRIGNFFIADFRNNRIRKVDATTGIITTVAGNGDFDFKGDGSPATSASLALPTDVAIDRVGNLFIADSRNNRIRKVDATTGIITTVAGNGTRGFSGDGGPATSAALGFSDAITVDILGNFFIFDSTNRRVRKVDVTTGIITTVVGNGGFSLDPRSGVVDSTGNLLVADGNNGRIQKVDLETGVVTTIAGGQFTFIGDNSPATSAILNAPEGLVTDGANIFIADLGGNRVRKVDATTGIITTIAGNGTRGGFNGDGGIATSISLQPSKVAVDGKGNLFIADKGTLKVRKVDATTGIITTVAGNGIPGFNGDGGPATSASLNPLAIVIDGKGNLIIGDVNRVRRVDMATGVISTIAGSDKGSFFGDGGPATSAGLRFPQGLAIDKAGNLFICDSLDNRIRKVDAITGIITTVVGNGEKGFSGDKGSATKAKIEFPQAVAIDDQGNLFIADSSNNRIRKVDTTGVINTVAGNGDISNLDNGDGGPAISATLSFPKTIAIDSAGNLFISGFDNVVRVIKGIGKNVEGGQREVLVSSTTFSKPNLTITGSGFGTLGASIKINGVDVSKFIISQSDSQIVLKGNSRKLAIKKGANSLVVTANGITSNTFTFNFLW